MQAEQVVEVIVENAVARFVSTFALVSLICAALAFPSTANSWSFIKLSFMEFKTSAYLAFLEYTNSRQIRTAKRIPT